MKLVFKKSDKNENHVYGYVDSDWAGDRIDRLQDIYLNYLKVLYLGLLANNQQLRYRQPKQNMCLV